MPGKTLRCHSPDYYASLILESIEQSASEEDTGDPPYLESLFGQQRQFVESKAKRKAALCSRRSGKTWGVGAWLLDGASRAPDGLSAYIALTRNSARGILWKTLQVMDRKLSLGLSFKEIDGQLMVITPNKHALWLVGCKDVAQTEKFRGYPFTRVAIDETGSFPPWIEYLIEDVLDPTLLDYDGEIAIVGTPGLTPAGYFYDATAGNDEGLLWDTFHWTVLDNPYIPHAEEWLARRRERKGWDESHPTYRREWLGQWVKDDEARIYPYEPARNAYYGDLQEPVTRVLSVDLGFDDCTAFVIGAVRPGLPYKYLERAWRVSGWTPAQTAAQIDQIRHQQQVDTIVIDEGGLGKSIAEDFRVQYGIPCVKAEKSGKQAAIHLLRGDLLAGVLKVNPHNCRHLYEEWTLLPWNEARTDHHESFVDDCSDATLYAYRALRNHYTPEEEDPRPGSAEQLEQEAAAHKHEAMVRLQRDRELPWWRRGSKRRSPRRLPGR